MKREPIRQGDILLMPVDSIPKGGERKTAKEMTIALGEATGHHHTLYPTKKNSEVTLVKIGNKEFVNVDPGYFLRHQEHKQKSQICPGAYEILREVEYDPFEEEMKRVVD